MKLSEAEVVVTTQQQIEKSSNKSDWFFLADYGDAGEFYNTCCSSFPDECNPQFRYPTWENIPDALINKEWFSSNFFELRDAAERIDEEYVDYFLEWCKYHGHNIAEDDPHQLIERYQEIHSCNPEYSCDELEIPDNNIDISYSIESYSAEVFDDNYD